MHAVFEFYASLGHSTPQVIISTQHIATYSSIHTNTPIYRHISSFKPLTRMTLPQDEMRAQGLAKFCRDCCLYNEHFTPEHVDIVFNHVITPPPTRHDAFKRSVRNPNYVSAAVRGFR